MRPSQWSLSPHCLHLQERKGARRGALLQGCPTLWAGKRQPLAMCSTTGRAGDPATSAKQHGKRPVASLIEGGSALFPLGPGLAQTTQSFLQWRWRKTSLWAPALNSSVPGCHPPLSFS